MNLNKTLTLAALASAALAQNALAAPPVKHLPQDPYGVCAHSTREERWDMDRLYPMMKEAGVDYIRFDIDQKWMQKSPGVYHADYEQQFLPALKHGLKLLPIVEQTPPDGAPFHWNDLDSYGRFVRDLAKKYGDRMKYWEIYNEANNGAEWSPNSEQYAKILKRTWKEMKGVNPDLKILYNGLALIPLDYIENSFKHGADKYFDIMNIHPYCNQPESLPPAIEPLWKLMKRYGVGSKPIWITEIGWASGSQVSTFFTQVVPYAAKRAGINPAECTVALLADPKAGYEGAGNYAAEHFPSFKGVKRVTLEELKTLDPKKYPILMPVVQEFVVGSAVPDLYRYVKNGGTLILPAGLPFYFDITLDGKGGSQFVQVNEKHLPQFHIAWDSWWTKRGVVPYAEDWQKPAPGMEGKFEWNDKYFARAGRFLSTRNLKPGDEFIPLVMGGNDKFQGPLVGLYRFNSEIKGNILMSTVVNIVGLTQTRQAQFLSRSFICSFASGVERVFFYCFHDMNDAKYWSESSFGVVDRQFKRKPGFYALKNLIKQLPGGSTVPTLESKGNVFLSNWTRPDGVKVWAIWYGFDTPESSERVKLSVTGKITEAVDNLGNAIPVPNGELTVTGSIQYLVGPEKITLQ